MRRPAVSAVALAAAVGTVALLVAAFTTSTSRAFTIGVLSTTPSGAIKAGQTACQKPIEVPPGGEFDSVDFQVGNFHRPAGPALDVSVRAIEGTLPRRHGVLPAGYPDVGEQQRQVVEVGPVPAGVVVEVCFRNRGPLPVALFGGSDGSAIESSGYLDGVPIGFDFDVVLRRDERSFASLLPEILQRASLFRPPWVVPGVFYVLMLMLLVGVPVLLACALRGIADRP